jgi:DNA (cytosine-5)-methyltransferase 1
VDYISTFSGIEAATVAWHPLGWNPVCFADIDKFPSAVLKHHYPDVPNVGDVMNVDWKEYKGKAELVVGGSPCQSFSIAGQRLGLDDPRGNLALHFLRIVRDVQPKWFIFENVPGLLSSDDGMDFATFLGEVAKCGYGFAYRILDAQNFGVPQRRRRIFVVGHIDGDWRRSAAVLFERESLFGDSKTRSKKRKDSPSSSTSGSIGQSQQRHALGKRVSPTVTNKWHKQSGGPSGSNECNNMVLVHSFDPAFGNNAGVYDEVSPGLKVNGLVPCPPAVTVAIQDAEGKDKAQGGKGWNDEGQSYTLSTRGTQGVLQPGKLTHAVRRLTPIECERLQGFPDDYTRIPYNGKPVEKCPDGKRYQALGNSMAVPVMRWLAERIELVDQIDTTTPIMSDENEWL